MQALKAYVHKGRLVLDEPTDLPEGEVVDLVPVDEVLARGGDYLDDEEREALEAALEEGERECEKGKGVSEEEFWSRLRTKP